MKLVLRLCLVFALVPFLLACGDDDDGSENNNAPAATATTGAAASDPSPAPSPTEAAAPKIDLSQDDLGRAVEVPEKAERVVAMSPTVVELMFAVGATPVGRPSSADYPEAANAVPDFGTSYQPSYEEIVAMEPDLIIADALIHEATIDELANLGAPVYALRVESFEDVTRGLRVVGALTGNQEAAETEAKALEDKLAQVEERIPEEKPDVLVVVGAGQGGIFVARGDSYVGHMVSLLGANNLAAEEPDSFRLPGFSEYSLERIVEADPDVIIAISPGPVPNVTTQALSNSPVWNSLTAVQEGRVHEVDPVVYIQAAGPRVSQILDELPGILYPDAFSRAR